MSRIYQEGSYIVEYHDSGACTITDQLLNQIATVSDQASRLPGGGWGRRLHWHGDMMALARDLKVELPQNSACLEDEYAIHTVLQVIVGLAARCFASRKEELERRDLLRGTKKEKVR
jgi:hypothetical protein